MQHKTTQWYTCQPAGQQFAKFSLSLDHLVFQAEKTVRKLESVFLYTISTTSARFPVIWKIEQCINETFSFSLVVLFHLMSG